jgi:ring-1,2-phenylacetyl-CoA epoxidase subunit PaaC
MNIDAIKDLLYRLADDELVTGHRNSEWTSLGPILEEDIAFSSMAQDEIGHAQAYYILLHELLGEAHPDQLAFNRKVHEFRSCHLPEYPIQDYAFSLVRHVLYDLAETVRLEALTRSSFRPLGELAKKLLREERYHELHAQTWIRQLGNATDEAQQRLQTALDQAFPLALGIWEPTAYDEAIAAEGIQPREAELEALWLAKLTELVHISNLALPQVPDKTVHYGGRQGQHTPHLAAMLQEMDEVFAIDTAAVW